MVMVFPISMKFCRCALASAFAFPLYWIACTMLMRLGLSSNSRFSTTGAEDIASPMVSRRIDKDTEKEDAARKAGRIKQGGKFC